MTGRGLYELVVTILILVDGFLQLELILSLINILKSHNPYFSRWFSAISNRRNIRALYKDVTILILVDGFLQLIVIQLLGV